ncbi:acyclic terpene utilization AtuA family protein [Nocardia sp. NPDC056100]|uniref:acyclic terpene utilization AtuA family protein n=1 Tax=Nocardia sp. NPDC056100 TaxID=3345712 RepID=UPI0035D933A0
MRNRAIRIGNFSGYLGDRYTAVDEVIAGDPIDVLVGDYLAEITMAALSARHHADPRRGFVEYFRDQIRPHLTTIAARGIKVVTNAGGFNPAGLAAELRNDIASAGADLTVAYVDGDNILSRLPTLRDADRDLRNLDSGAPLASWPATPIAANAYLGGWGITAALAAGADIVVCGRVTDAALTSGPAAWWHDWGRQDWDALAGGVVAGHIIECGAHAVGGNFSGFTGIGKMLVPGFPIAEIASDGSCVITKHARDDGAVTVDTVTAQLVYEIQGPRYLSPDVTAHLEHIELTPIGPDRVEVRGTRGSPPPPTTKVAMFGLLGYSVVNTVFVTGLDVTQKLSLLRAQLGRDMPAGVEIDLTPIGVVADDPRSQWEGTIAVRVMATADTEKALARYGLARRIGGLYLQTIPGFFHDGGSVLNIAPTPRVDYWPGLLPLSDIEHRVTLADGQVSTIAPAEITRTAIPPAESDPEPLPALINSRRAPLGKVAYARSGDKGGNSNVGVWTPHEQAWPWLRRFLTTAEIRRLLPETAGLDIERHEFPHLRAVHFVLRGLLGTGGSSNTRIDQVGKAVGEYLRAKQVPIPADLMPDGEN